MNGDELRVELVRLADGRRAVRLTHVPTAITVEDDLSNDAPPGGDVI